MTDIDNNGFFEEKKPVFNVGDKIRFSQTYREFWLEQIEQTGMTSTFEEFNNLVDGGVETVTMVYLDRSVYIGEGSSLLALPQSECEIVE